MRAKLTITHTHLDDDRPGPGWYDVCIETPGWHGTDDRHQTFCYGDDEIYDDAQSALEAALTYYDGAAAMFAMLSRGGCDTAISRRSLRQQAEKIDKTP